MHSGKLFLVGVGPGDPELLTRRAERVLHESDVVYHPGRDDASGFAIGIVRAMLRPGTVVRAIPVELSEDADRYESLATRLASEVQVGRRVSFITEGDPLVYSTAARLLTVFRRDWPDLPLEIVSGVTSLCAAAAAAQQSLVESDETLVVVPACHHPNRLAELIERHDCVALVKIGSVFAEIVELLKSRGWLDRAVYVERVGTKHEVVRSDVASIDPARVPYFSMILVRTR